MVVELDGLEIEKEVNESSATIRVPSGRELPLTMSPAARFREDTVSFPESWTMADLAVRDAGAVVVVSLRPRESRILLGLWEMFPVTGRPSLLEREYAVLERISEMSVLGGTLFPDTSIPWKRPRDDTVSLPERITLFLPDAVMGVEVVMDGASVGVPLTEPPTLRVTIAVQPEKIFSPRVVRASGRSMEVI